MFRTKSQFEKLFDKATSNLLLEPDWESNLQLCDMIRGGDIKPREAAAIIKTKVVEEKNPHVLFFAVNVLDIVMKNCGDPIHTEIITESFMEQIKELVKAAASENVKSKLLEVVQLWGLGFKDKPDLKVATNLYNIMKAEGYKFPTPPSGVSDMFKSEKAPVWSDGDECLKCKAEFGFVQRKHHCRACGGIFCNKCSSKQAIIPKFGIEKEVRVCDNCYSSLNKKSKSESSDLPAEYLSSPLSKQSQEPPPKDEAALKEEEELQLALALSLDEQENKNRIRLDQINNDTTYATVTKPTVQSSPAPTAPPAVVDAEEDPDLARYLNRSYWDKKKDEINKQKGKDSQKKPSEEKKSSKKSPEPAPEEVAPDVIEESEVQGPARQEENLQNGDVPENEELLNNLRTSIEIFTNRMKSDQMRGRSIATDSTVQTLFQSINNMHPMLIQFMNELEEKRLQQEALQDKLVQLRDARAALDALRTEHAEKMKRVAEEAERQRQIQMVKKLELMRQKKQEYLAYQRQQALQRMQEQEAARQARLEQHKQFIQQRAMQPSMLIAGYNTQYPNAGEQVVDVQQGMIPGNYGYGGGYVQGQVTQPIAQQHYQQPPAGQHYQGAPVTTGYSPAPGGYEATAGYPHGQGMMMQQGTPGQPPNDSYNMASMNSALPHQPNVTGHQQVVATAPPPTPQPTPVPQQINSTQAGDPNVAMYQMQQPQQTFYQHGQEQQPAVQQQQQPPPPQQLQQNQDLLILFD